MESHWKQDALLSQSELGESLPNALRQAKWISRVNRKERKTKKKTQSLYFYRELWKIDYNICVPHVVSFNINWPLSAIMFELFVVHTWESSVCPLDAIFAIIHIINVTLTSTLRFAPQHDNWRMHLLREPCRETYSAPAVSIEAGCPGWLTWASQQNKWDDRRHPSCAPIYCVEVLSLSHLWDIVLRRHLFHWEILNIAYYNEGCVPFLLFFFFFLFLNAVLWTEFVGGVKIDPTAAWQAGVAWWSSVFCFNTYSSEMPMETAF